MADGHPPQGQPDHPVGGWEFHGGLLYHPNASDQTGSERWQQLHASPVGIRGNEHRREFALPLHIRLLPPHIMALN